MPVRNAKIATRIPITIEPGTFSITLHTEKRCPANAQRNVETAPKRSSNTAADKHNQIAHRSIHPGQSKAALRRTDPTGRSHQPGGSRGQGKTRSTGRSTSPSTFAEYSAAFGHASFACEGGGTPPPGQGAVAEQLNAGAEAQVITEEQLRKAEEYVQQEEGAANRLSGWVGVAVTAIAVAMTLFHLYAAYDIVPTIPLRYTHVAFVLVLSFLLFPLDRKSVV